jgi:hypothetical protein
MRTFLGVAEPCLNLLVLLRSNLGEGSKEDGRRMISLISKRGMGRF